MQRKPNFLSKLFSIISFVSVQIFALIWILPYIIEKLFLSSKKKQGRKSGINLKLRRILEFNQTKQVMGISLSVLLLFASVLQTPFQVSTVKASSESENKVEQIIDSILTEKTYQVPVFGYISQFFTTYHPALDYANNYLANIYPISEGHVISVEYGFLGYGNSVLIDHGNGLISRYAHLQSINVSLGQAVNKADVIGLVGSTGWSTGPHLHLETIYNGEKINPLSLIK